MESGDRVCSCFSTVFQWDFNEYSTGFQLAFRWFRGRMEGSKEDVRLVRRLFSFGGYRRPNHHSVPYAIRPSRLIRPSCLPQTRGPPRRSQKTTASRKKDFPDLCSIETMTAGTPPRPFTFFKNYSLLTPHSSLLTPHYLISTLHSSLFTLYLIPPTPNLLLGIKGCSCVCTGRN